MAEPQKTKGVEKDDGNTPKKLTPEEMAQLAEDKPFSEYIPAMFEQDRLEEDHQPHGEPDKDEDSGTPAVAYGNPSGRTSLLEAAESGDVEVVRCLLETDADINAVDKHGESALMIASALGNVEVVRVLLAAGADVRTPTPYGSTALMLAEAWGQLEVAGILRSAGIGKEAALATANVIASDATPIVT